MLKMPGSDKSQRANRDGRAIGVPDIFAGAGWQVEEDMEIRLPDCRKLVDQ